MRHLLEMVDQRDPQKRGTPRCIDVKSRKIQRISLTPGFVIKYIKSLNLEKMFKGILKEKYESR